MKKSSFLLLAFFVVLSGFFTSQRFVNQQAKANAEVESLQREIDELEHLKQLSEDATKPLEKEVDTLESRITNARYGISKAQADAVAVESKIEQREKDLAVQYQILSRRVHEQYKKARMFSPLLFFIQNANAAELTKDLAYRDSVKAQDNKLIQTIGTELFQLEEDKAELEQTQKTLKLGFTNHVVGKQLSA